MKTKLASLLALALLLGGCSFKGDTITLGEHKPSYSVEKKAVSQIQIEKFVDSRREKPLVAVVKDSSHETIRTIFSTHDLGDWLSVAFSKELSAISILSKDGAPVVVSADIKELNIEYMRSPINTKNLKLQAHIEMTMSQNGKSLKKDYFLKEEKYISLISTSAELAPHIQDILSQVAVSMSKDVVSWSANKR
jgi:uncharacterized lipoprotein YajG